MLPDDTSAHSRWGDTPAQFVFLHGGGQNSHTWDSVIVALGVPALAVDLPGHGHSDPILGSSALDLANSAPDVAAAIRALAPNALAVAGMSLGGHIIAVDACGPVSPHNAFSGGPRPTISPRRRGQVEATGRSVVARQVDVRDLSALQSVCQDGAGEFGGIDIVVANAGISNWNRFWEMPEDQWQTMIDVNLTGVWRTFKAATPGWWSR